MSNPHFLCGREAGAIVAEIVTVYTVHDPGEARLGGEPLTQGVQRLLAEIAAVGWVGAVSRRVEFVHYFDVMLRTELSC